MARNRVRKTTRKSPSRLVRLSLGDRAHEPVKVPRLVYTEEARLSDGNIVARLSFTSSLRNPNWIGDKMRKTSVGFKYSPVRASIVVEALADDAARTAAATA